MEIYRIGSTLDEALVWFLETGPWGARTRVLQPGGQFIARPVWYFEPDRDREQIMFKDDWFKIDSDDTPDGEKPEVAV